MHGSLRTKVSPSSEAHHSILESPIDREVSHHTYKGTNTKVPSFEGTR